MIMLEAKILANLFKVIKNTLIAETGRLSYYLTLPFFKRNIWIISETENQAQENGYQLFCWIKENRQNIEAFYVINKNSPAIGKFKDCNNWLDSGSFKMIFYLYHANRIISTHGLWMIPNELGILKKITRKTLKGKRVMLNHGVGFLKNGKQYYHKSSFPLNDLITALSQKDKNIFLNEYGYQNEDVKITGYARFDSMIDTSKQAKWHNMILLMPTFRDQEKGLQEKFKKTELYDRIQRMVIDKEFQHFLEEKNCHLAIYLHQDIQDYSIYLDKFSTNRIHIIRQGEFTVTELLGMSKLLITDYSSVLFDFVYMNKPFISYQFDYSAFINSRENKPFIDIRTELPGYVVTKHNELINTIQTIAKNNFTILPKHKKCATQYFTYQDKGNCKRIYEEIEKL
jgi:hypothetical protein